MATVDVIDAIQQTLESEGALQTIRAQLRSKVFEIVSKKEGYSRFNRRAIDFISTSEGEDEEA
jgi:hypothetical protein